MSSGNQSSDFREGWLNRLLRILPRFAALQDKLRRVLQENSTLQEDLVDLQNKYRRLEEENSALRERSAEVEGEIAKILGEKAELLAQAEALKTEVAQHNSKINDCEEQLYRVRTDNSSLKREHTALLARIEQEGNSIQARIEDIQKRLDKAEKQILDIEK